MEVWAAGCAAAAADAEEEMAPEETGKAVAVAAG